MSEGGQITIRLKELGGKVLIQFEDQGCGIPEDLLKRFGDPFFTTNQGGTGLGLMVTRKIIENHNGTLDFMSQVGTGTVVSVVLPCEVPGV